MGIAHRDISMENVLFTNCAAGVQIIDFGLCIGLYLQDAETAVWQRTPCVDAQGRKIVVGKRGYMAPEVLNLAYTSYDATKADVWSMGVCFFSTSFCVLNFITF